MCYRLTVKIKLLILLLLRIDGEEYLIRRIWLRLPKHVLSRVPGYLPKIYWGLLMARLLQTGCSLSPTQQRRSTDGPTIANRTKQNASPIDMTSRRGRRKCIWPVRACAVATQIWARKIMTSPQCAV